MSLPLATIDLELARRGSMGQDPIEVRGSGAVETVAISRPYGRLGNNLYQMLNAALVARATGFHRLEISEGMAGLKTFTGFQLGDLHIAPADGAHPALTGSFYVPYGCERPVLSLATAEIDDLVRSLCDALFGDIIAQARQDYRIVVAFRGGDVFVEGGGTPFAYTQPPAAYYLRAIDHARSTCPDCMIELVYADRANPAVAIVERALEAGNIPYRTQAAGFLEDFSKLVAARTLISCPSTFVEAATLVSRNLRTLYSFRDHCSQPEFKPFMQWQLAPLLERRGIRGFLVDDASRTYTNKWQWAATAAQLHAIEEFDIANLRLYEAF